MKRTQRMEQTRWDLALRYRLIETVVWWEGRLTTNHLIQSFGISRQQASKDINTYINDYASKNLVYDKQIKGYVPTRQFKPLFIDDSASAYLDLLNQNNERAPHIEGLALAYAHTEVLKVPDRSVKPEVLRPLLKACREKRRLDIDYVSFNTPNSRDASSPRTRWCTPACAGTCGPIAKRTACTATLYSAVSVVCQMCTRRRPRMVSTRTWNGTHRSM